MDEFNDFLASVTDLGGSAMLNDLIAYLGFKNHKINYINDCLAEVAYVDLTILFGRDLHGYYFAVYDASGNIQDRAYFKWRGGKWVEAD